MSRAAPTLPSGARRVHVNEHLVQRVDPDQGVVKRRKVDEVGIALSLQGNDEGKDARPAARQRRLVNPDVDLLANFERTTKLRGRRHTSSVQLAHFLPNAVTLSEK